MNILLKNYKNIEHLEYEIEDKKCNFLFGICGSGKSSIIGALSNSNLDGTKTIGSENTNQIIKVNGQEVNKEDYLVFNEETIKRVLFDKAGNNDTYNIFIHVDDTLIGLEANYNNLINELRIYEDKIRSFKSKVDDITFLKLTKKEGVSTTCKFHKARNSLSEMSLSTLNLGKKYGSKFITWHKEGKTINDKYKKKICPFCNQSIEHNYNELENISEIEPKQIEALIKDSKKLENIGIDVSKINFYEDTDYELIKSQFIKKKRIADNLQKIIYLYNANDLENTNEQLNTIDLDGCVYEEFPYLEEIVEKINKNINEINILIRKVTARFRRIQTNQLAKLSSKLRVLGIPYKFKMNTISRRKKECSFQLVHVDDKESSMDRRDYLSTGEKNIIALLLFLELNNKDTILIDDPASSFDDCRRKQLYDLIIEKTKGKTVLIVSHDQVFVKYAILEQYMNSHNGIGKVDIIINANGKTEIKSIAKTDFISLSDEIKKRISSSNSYYQKLINTRLYFEIQKNEYLLQYSYLSGLLHNCSDDEYNMWLEKNEVSEIEMLNSIYEMTNVMFEVSNRHSEKIDLSKLSLFEKIVYYRENIDEGNEYNAELKKLLSDIVHMNAALQVVLNPYTFEYFPKSVIEYINQQK